MKCYLNKDFNILNDRIEKKLNMINDKVNEKLEDNFEKTNKTFSNVLERLAKIDEAQKKIDGLSTEIVSLESILTDKKSRGIFGEVNLYHILSSIFGEKNVPVGICTVIILLMLLGKDLTQKPIKNFLLA